MENEKKGKKFLEIILIVLVALSFVLIPLLNQYRNKISPLNNTQLVKREANGDGSSLTGKNGNVLFTTTNDVYTFYSNVGSITLNLSFNAYQSLINGDSVSGSNDVFGYNCTNYFRFVYNSKYHNALAEDFDKIYDLVYYIELDNSKSISLILGYWEIWYEPASSNVHFTSIDDMDFNRVGIIPSYSVLNVSYYNSDIVLNGLIEYLGSLSKAYLIVNSNYQISKDVYGAHSFNRTRFINIDKDFITPLVDVASSSSYTDGYRDGYKIGIDDTSGNSVFGVLQKASSAISSFLNIEVLPNLSLWLLISIPFSISIMVILLRLLRGGS